MGPSRQVHGATVEMWSRILNSLKHSIPYQAMLLLPTGKRQKLLLLIVVQVALGTIDLVAVALVGVLGVLAVAAVQSSRIGDSGTIGKVLSLLNLDSLPVTTQVAVLGVITGILFISRTIASIHLTRRALHFLGTRAAELSANLIERLLQQSLIFLQRRSSQDLIYSTTSSANSLVLGVLGTVVIMSADVALLVAMGAMLIYVSPYVALAAGVLLASSTLMLHRLTTQRAQSLGSESAQLDVESRELLVEAIATFRDMHVRRSQDYYAEASKEVRLRAASVTAEWTFLPNISKYVLEATVIVAALIIGGLEFLLKDAQSAIGILTLFLAAGTRLAPATIRLQQAFTSLRWSIGQSVHALTLDNELEHIDHHYAIDRRFTTDHPGFVPSISVRGVEFSYPNSQFPAIQAFTFKAAPGQLVALVGPSGAGKSTVADVLLGVLQPQSGDIVIAGDTPKEVTSRWPGAVAYVSQDIWIADTTIRRNVALGFENGTVPDADIWRALEAARLAEFTRGLPHGLETRVGERGAKLSGGQRQRLGIARALVTQPQLLVLDEATSALDAITEREVTDAIRSLHGKVTVVAVAHRLSTVRHADLVIYMQSGQIVAMGDFDQVRAAVPDFHQQASLMGLE